MNNGLFADGGGVPQSLAEKYRPRTIDDFIGLAAIKKTLANFALRPRDKCGFVFSGPSGVGKTSMAQAFCTAIAGEFHHMPSGKCTLAAIDDLMRQCWYVPMNGKFHVCLVDEADCMTAGAQMALLSKLDSTDAAPRTIWIFTCNSTKGLEDRFMSRNFPLEFSSYGMRESLIALLARVWAIEAPNAPVPDLARIAKDATNNVRTALMALELELLQI